MTVETRDTEFRHPERAAAPEPVSWSGQAAKADHVGFDRYSDAPHTWRIFRAGQNKFLVQASYNLCYPTATFGYRIHEKCQGKERGQSRGGRYV